MKKLSLLLLLVGASSCVTEGNYTDALAKTSCQREEECYQARFDDEYSSISDCVDDRVESFDDVDKCYQEAGCEFDLKKAKECKKAYSSATCEDFEDGVDDDSCDDIYDCSTSQQAEVLRCIIGG